MKFIDSIRATADSVEQGAPVAGGMAITADLVSSISHDGPRATLLAFISVVVLAFVIFRDLRTIGLVLFALVIGVTWFAGLVLGLGLKINFQFRRAADYVWDRRRLRRQYFPALSAATRRQYPLHDP